jgi:hypothetical protein
VFTQENGGFLVKDDDILKINAGGTIFTVRRETLTQVKGSRLEVLFSGRWENRLLRDEDGNIFIDVDSDCFKKILDYLYMIKLSASAPSDAFKVEIPADGDEMTDLYVDFFGIGDELNRGAPSSLSQRGMKSKPKAESVYDKIFDCIEKEEKALVKLESDLEKCAKHMGEEGYVSFFITRTSDEEEEDVEEEEDFAMINDENDDKSQTSNCPSLKKEDANSTLNLYLAGKIMTVKRSTLCFHKDSLLAKQFADDKWIQANTIALTSGKDAVLIEQPLSSFVSMVNQLRVGAMLKPNKEYFFTKAFHEAPMLKQLVTHYFPGKEDVILGDIHAFKSKIIDFNDSTQIMKWLEERNKVPEPELLYRASHDGWSQNIFHSKCDHKGATVTIAKTTKGFVIGAYSDKSFASTNRFESSSKAFLFSTKCNAGLPPFMMELRYNMHHYALYHGSHSGPCFGNQYDFSISNAGFGNQYDFSIGNAVSMKYGYYSLGSGSYHLPDFVETTFLDGEDGGYGLEFDEVEVFAV